MKVKEIRIAIDCYMWSALYVAKEIESELGFDTGMTIIDEDGNHYGYHSADAKKVMINKMSTSEYANRHRIEDDQ